MEFLKLKVTAIYKAQSTFVGLNRRSELRTVSPQIFRSEGLGPETHIYLNF